MADVHDVAALILDESGPMDAMKLQKLLYYSQAWHAAITGQPLFDQPVEAWRDGPVVKAVFDEHKGLRRVTAWPVGEARKLTGSANRIVKLVCAHYGPMSGDELSTLTHGEKPWLATRGGLSEGSRSRRQIPVPLMASFYRGRELAGRKASDLASGGIAQVQRRLSGAELAEFRSEMRHMREARRSSKPEHTPDPMSVIGRGQFERAGHTA